MLVLVKGLSLDSGVSLVVGSLVSSLATVFLFLLTKWCSVDYLAVRRENVKPVVIAVLLALSLMVPLAWLEEMIPEQLVKDNNTEAFEFLLSRVEGYVIIGLMAPLCEEIVFRGVILRCLLQRFAGRYWIAIAISALLFAVAHFNPAQTPHALVVGVLLGWMCYRTGSLLPGIAYHWVNNTSVFLLCALFPELPYDAQITDFFAGHLELLPLFIVGGSLASLLLVWGFSKGRWLAQK